jgi:hypothetical protein
MLMILAFIARQSCCTKDRQPIFLFLKNKLKLPINREKSGIRKPVQFSILGHKYVPTYEKGTKGKYQLIVSERAGTTETKPQNHHP